MTTIAARIKQAPRTSDRWYGCMNPMFEQYATFTGRLHPVAPRVRQVSPDVSFGTLPSGMSMDMEDESDIIMEEVATTVSMDDSTLLHSEDSSSVYWENLGDDYVLESTVEYYVESTVKPEPPVRLTPKKRHAFCGSKKKM